MNPTTVQTGSTSPFEIASFLLFALIALAGAFGTVLPRNPIRGAVGLFFHIVALAGLYITLGAHFLGVIQLLIYAGAVVVLFVFVIMLLGPDANPARDVAKGLVASVISAVAVGLFAFMLITTVVYVRMPLHAAPEGYGTLRQVGEYLYNDAVIPFELIGITLVVAVVGAFAVARGHHRKRDVGLGGDASVAGHDELARHPEFGRRRLTARVTGSGSDPQWKEDKRS